MKSLLLTLVLTFFLTCAFAQYSEDCGKVEKLFVRVEHPAQFNGSLQAYFDSTLAEKLKKFEGSIQLNILVDSIGRACCMNIKNNDSKVTNLELKNIITNMPLWKPAIQNGYMVNYSVILYLSRFNKKFSVSYPNGN